MTCHFTGVLLTKLMLLVGVVGDHPRRSSLPDMACCDRTIVIFG